MALDTAPAPPRPEAPDSTPAPAHTPENTADTSPDTKLRLHYRALAALATARSRVESAPENARKKQRLLRKLGGAALTPLGLAATGVIAYSTYKVGGQIPDALMDLVSSGY